MAYDIDPNLSPAKRRRAIQAKHRELIKAIFRDNLKHALSKVKDFPDSWDGHEIRELIYKDAEWQRTSLMRTSRGRRANFERIVSQQNLLR